MAKEKTIKVKKDKIFTRAQALRALTKDEVKPSKFLDMADPFARPDPKNPGAAKNHGNYHCRARAWKLMGSPIPSEWSKEDTSKFLASIHVKEEPVVETVEEVMSFVD